MNVKICGLTRPEDASLAIEHGADALGFIFYPKSKRFIEPARVAEFSQDFPIPRVGVSVNAEVAEYESWIKQNAVDVLQLHGEESPSQVGQASRLSSSPALEHRYGFNWNSLHKISRRHLPHLHQGDAIYFITFRLADSLPQDRLEELRKQNEDPLALSQAVSDYLDAGKGSCALADSAVSEIVEKALQFHDGTKYRLGRYVIMPNHVHVLLAPLRGHDLSSILHSVTSYTAHEIQKLRHAAGQFWQEESFDHIVRNVFRLADFEHYIDENPGKASLSEGAFRVGGRYLSRRSPKGDRRDACPTFSELFTFKALAIPLKPGQLDWPDYPDASAFLLDANVPEYGGSGHTVDWSLAAEFVRACDRPVILSGGLTPENVAQAINQVHPWGVDVSSGVESSPGIKDPAKLRDFLQICKAL
jgi:phosphoribosylanthranilate isomerase/REP element-mobilizing transposase RayT